jgi:hypothetical protein
MSYFLHFELFEKQKNIFLLSLRVPFIVCQSIYPGVARVNILLIFSVCVQYIFFFFNSATKRQLLDLFFGNLSCLRSYIKATSLKRSVLKY